MAHADQLRYHPDMLTEDEKRERRRLKSKAWRDANLERSREIVRLSMKRAAAAKAIAEGREPGKRGPPRQFTEEEKRAKRLAKQKRYYALNLDKEREKARIREQAKRDGTFVSKGRPRLTEDQRKRRDVVLSAKRRTRISEAGGSVTPQQVAFLRHKQRDFCFFCGNTLGDAPPHLDHHVPIAMGGSSDLSNLRLLHEFCNLRKGAVFPHPADRAMQHSMLAW